MDAYRAAFEEQLCKNKQLMVQLAEVAVSGPTRMEKAKAIIKNLVHLLNDGKKHFSQSISSLGSAPGRCPVVITLSFENFYAPGMKFGGF